MSASLLHTVILLGVAVALPICLHMIVYRVVVRLLCARCLVRKNSERVNIPTAGGFLLVGYITVTLLVVSYLHTVLFSYTFSVKRSLLFITGSLAVALWGLQDDRSSDKTSKGFRGHFTTLYKEERMTSGLLKAIGIGGTSFIISVALGGGALAVLLHTGILALSSNFINLFDLRPGRAIKMFWIASFLLLLSSKVVFSIFSWTYFLPIIISVALVFVHDVKGKIMLGDTGSNYLGFLLGYGVVLFLSVEAKMVALLLLIWVTVAGERVSFSYYIEKVRWLWRLDQWGR
jgi:UDP-GlcNAc:undecaprenyl-phosphate/decaprenyl-phosphate GlcNAc-1-phosphate transferase